MLLVFMLGCQSDAGNEKDATSAAFDTASGSLLSLFGDDAVMRDWLASEDSTRIAESFPVPDLPGASQGYRMQPDARFERWVLSSMTRVGNPGTANENENENEDKSSASTDEWRWLRQEFFRVALVGAERRNTNAERSAPASAWAFSDVVAQRRVQHDFASSETTIVESAERMALNLASATSDTLALNDISLTIAGSGCQSVLTVTRGDSMRAWPTEACPDRVKISDAVASRSTNVLPDTVQWVSQAYGQLPTGLGAVVIDRLDVILPDDTALSVNRSRRRSGSGPVTLSATLGGNPLPDVEWLDLIDNESSVTTAVPTAIEVRVPSLSQTFSVPFPEPLSQALNSIMGQPVSRESSSGNPGVEHGVLVSTAESANQSLPGRLYFNAIVPQER